MSTLRELREARGCSLRAVEIMTGISRGTLSKVERGLEVPSAEQLVQLSRFYEVDPTRWVARVQYVIDD